MTDLDLIWFMCGIVAGCIALPIIIIICNMVKDRME